MAGTCTFCVRDVRVLVEHAKNSPAHRPDNSHLEHDNNQPVSAGLWLVGGNGIYLKSNGIPYLLDAENEQQEIVVFSKESNPTSGGLWLENKQRIFGCNIEDEVVYLPIKVFDDAMKLNDNNIFHIKVSPINVKVISFL